MYFYHQEVCFRFVFLLFMAFILYSHCKVSHPSWAELAQFARFLYVQLNDCQNSVYCKQVFGEDTDFKTFVVKFMITMSKVCYYYYFNNYRNSI